MVKKTEDGGHGAFPLRMPDGMRTRIKERAEVAERSMHSLIIAALEEALAAEQTPELTFRLRELVHQVKKAREDSEDVLVKVAERAPTVDALSLRNSFAGTPGGLSFLELNAIAGLWGVRPDWLKHGTGAMFEVRRTCGFDGFAADQFFHSRAKKLSVLRSDGPEGSVLIVIQRDYGIFEIIDPCLELTLGSEQRWLKPEAEFANACLYLCKFCPERVDGYVVYKPHYERLKQGYLYPGFVIDNMRSSAWLTEWWDEGKLPDSSARDHWSDYREFCQEIRRFIDARQWLREERESILGGSWKSAQSNFSALVSR